MLHDAAALCLIPIISLGPLMAFGALITWLGGMR